MQDKESFMCGFNCIAIIEYAVAGKNLLDYANLFYPNELNKKNDNIIYKYFKGKCGRKRKYPV